MSRELSLTATSRVRFCHDAKSLDPVVVKSMPATVAIAGRDHDNATITRELWANTQLIQAGGHPHLVLMRTAWQAKDTVHIMFDYCNQGDLYSYMQQMPKQRMSEALAIQVLRQVVHGLMFMAARGIAHRDISLENILVHNGVCKVADFGLSVPGDQMTTGCVGRPYYAAPEVMAGKTYDPLLADVWSLGVMLFIMITGSPIGERATIDDPRFSIIPQVGVRGILLAWGMGDLVSRATEDLLNRMLAWDPADRLVMEDIVSHQAFRGG
ncbi:TPA: hypothetical protein N0F65_003276 [Lagenidium giganteum]|uniref:Protein kinase domain-containing protein n=1 Tax=Lagenidium giganteum TaxID=4803 RepID=A0AAV2YH36_9STRA|nr:TPA: hypothetical protein N0F65_003276 [Lagenidium giganteum]